MQKRRRTKTITKRFAFRKNAKFFFDIDDIDIDADLDAKLLSVEKYLFLFV